MNLNSHVRPAVSIRYFLMRAGGGFGALALAYLMNRDGALASETTAAAKLAAFTAQVPHFAPRAKSVIWLFMEGGPSHIDILDPKPALDRLAGQPMPKSFGRVITAMGTSDNTLLPTKRKFARHGKSGLWIS